MIRPFRKYSHIGLGLLLVTGLGLAVILCLQCIRTYMYIGRVLVPQQAEREAERQWGALGTAAQAAGISDPHALGALMQTGSNVIWMRLLGPDNAVLAQAGTPQGAAAVPAGWWQRVEKHESLGRVIETAGGKALVAQLPFRMPPPHHAIDSNPHHEHGPGGRPGAYVLDIAIRLDSVSGAFAGLRQIARNLSNLEIL